MIILITGATSGIGKAIADYMFSKGHQVFSAGRRVDDQIRQDAISTLKMDVTDESSVNEAVGKVIREVGSIDVLIQCAGQGAIGPVEGFAANDIADVFNLNLLGVHRVNKVVLPQMRKQGYGRIILISSLAAETGLPYQGVYSASKAALDVLTESLRMEVRTFGIEACVLQPGDFKTEVALSRKLPILPMDSPYKESFERINKNATTKVDLAQDPLKVAKRVNMILQKKKLKPKYRVGSFLEVIMPTIKIILPASLFERMIMSYYGLK